MKIRNMVFTAVFAAVLCVVSPLTIPIGPIPLSLATFAIYLAASTLDWKYGTLSVVVYVALGLVGLPVFSRFEGGIHKLVGPSGGFIVGYILMALAAGLILSRYPRKRWLYPVAMALGTVVLYGIGLAWFMYSTGSALGASLMACVVPFLPGDAIKITLVTLIAPRLRTFVDKQQG
jgi:biotin transport system substrate-specific component